MGFSKPLGVRRRALSPTRPPFYKSLSFRLTLFFALLLSVVLVGFYIALSYRQQQGAMSLVDDELRRDRALAGSASLETLSGLDGLLWQRVDADGTPVARSASLGDERLPIDREALQESRRSAFETVTVPWRDHTLRIARFPYAANDDGRGQWLQLALPLESLEETADSFRAALVVTFPIILIITIISGVSIAKKALLPIGQITDAARRISADNLSDRLTVTDAGDELDRLSETFNDMISRLEASFEQIRRFTADASHELRTPLTAIRGETETALSLPRTPEQYQRVMVSTLEEVDRLSSIVSDLLVLSRSVQRNELNLQTLALDGLLEEIGAHLQILAEDRGVTLEIGSMEPVELLGDSMRLMQLLSNLVDNAIKYTTTGGKVTLELARKDDEAVVTVSDTGIGIGEADLPHIFDRFYRADLSRAKANGIEAELLGAIASTGLGLSICLWIAQAHGGRIDVESVQGEGSTFRVSLPIDGVERPNR